MDAPLISHQRTADQREHHDQDNPLFAFRKNENPNQAIHFSRNEWDLYPGFAETFQPQETGIALAAGKAFRRRIVTTVGE